MTGYTVHTGATEKFCEGWDRVFGGKSASTTSSKTKKAAAGNARKTAQSARPKKSAKKSATKKSARKK